MTPVDYILAGIVLVSVLIGVIRGFLRYVERHTFTLFAWYRIAFGAGLLLFLARRGG